MAIRSETDVTFQKFSGLRNNVAESSFKLDDLSVALNVDLNDDGVVSRRKGFSAPEIVGDYHSLWSGAGVCLAVSGTTLNRILPGYTATALRTDLTTGRRLSYYAVGNRAYYSNGVETGVVESGEDRSWGIVPPGRISATAVSGTLRSGRYQFTLTYERLDGQESGSPLAGVLELSEPGGLRFSDLPVSTDPGVTAKILYISKVNGETLFRRAAIAADATTFDVTDDWLSLVPLRTQHLSAAPPGDIVSSYNGRMLVANGPYLRYSEPYAYELFDARRVLTFDSAIKMVAPVEDGLFVATENSTVFLKGDDIALSAMLPKAEYGVIPGTLAFTQASSFGDGSQSGTLAVWASKEGLCVGTGGGVFRNLTQDRFAYPKQPQGAALFRQHRGTNQYLAVLQGAEIAGNIHV